MKNWSYISILTILLSVTQLLVKSQSNIEGRTNYPDSMEFNKEIVYQIANDTLVQTISVKAIGSGKLLYSIEKNIKDDGMYGGRLIENFNGTANWSGAYGVVVGEDMTMHLDQWEYTSTDNMLTIIIYGKNASQISLQAVNFDMNYMELKKE